MTESISGRPRREWLDHRGVWWAASAAFIALVVLGLGGVLLYGGREAAQPESPAAAPAPATSATAPPAATGVPTASETAGTSGTCAPDAEDQAPPATPPRDVQWEIYNTMALPWSPSAGALQRDGAMWSCYARTPTGALLAATVLSATSTGPDAAKVLAAQALPGPNRDALIAEAEADPAQPNAPGSAAAVAGYRVFGYTPDSATVQIVYTFGGKYFTWTASLAWDEDWKLDLNTPGGNVPSQQIDSLEGYTPWGAT